MLWKEVNWKPVGWFLAIAVVVSWTLFLLPLALTEAGGATRQTVTLVTWSLAMWGPGLAALVVTRRVELRSFRSLGLGRLGPKRFYIWAWLLPPLLALAAGALTVIFGIARLDLGFTAIREAIAATPQAAAVPFEVILVAQIGIAVLAAPLVNVIFALGEELGWRGFLLPHLLPLGQARALLLTGVVWGIWHAPAIAQGHNYPGHPVEGIFLMVVFCVLIGIIFGWIYLRTRSPWAPALAHGALNATAGLPFVFYAGGGQAIDPTLGGTLTSATGFIVLLLVVVWLVGTRRLPVSMRGDVPTHPGVPTEPATAQ